MVQELLACKSGYVTTIGDIKASDIFVVIFNFKIITDSLVN